MNFDREKFITDLRYLASLNIPWHHQGDSDPAIGFDCIGAPKYAYELQGLRLPDELNEAFSAYHRPPNGRHLLAVMRKHLNEILFGMVEPSDLVVVFARRNPCHVLTKVSGVDYVEAFENPTGVSCLRVTQFDPLSKVAACFRIPDFA